MEQGREVLEIRETVAEEFLIDGIVVARETAEIDELVEIGVETVVVGITSGADHRFAFVPAELAKVLRAAAIAYFVGEGLITESPTLALFKGATVLNAEASLGSQGVVAGEELLLASTERPVDG